MDKKPMMGHRLRRFRQEQGLNQAEMAERLAISPSYLNLIERNQRPLTVPILFRLGQAFAIDLRAFAEDDEAKLVAGLREVFGDPLFQEARPSDGDLRELASASPLAAQAVLALYRAFAELRGQATSDNALPEAPAGTGAADRLRDFLEARGNHFSELEAAAQALVEEIGPGNEDLAGRLARLLESSHGIAARVLPHEVMGDVLRRFDPHRRRVLLSETLAPGARAFQLAAELALLGRRDLLEGIIAEAGLGEPGAEQQLRIALANYFAGAVLLPYEPFLAAAKALRHDVELLQARFGAGFEQVCHRLTTLQRPGARGLPFFFMRVDVAGNISKRLSAGGFALPRFGGTCPRWLVHLAFQQPGRVLSQFAAMPDGKTYFAIARTLPPRPGQAGGGPARAAVTLGCDARHAGQLVYADGLDLREAARAEPIGPGCRTCERLDCAERALPPVTQRPRADEHVRRRLPFGLSVS
jgi:predicted transcriptional regulator/transcriptional regulator with XRE-family HTH domain